MFGLIYEQRLNICTIQYLLKQPLCIILYVIETTAVYNSGTRHTVIHRFTQKRPVRLILCILCGMRVAGICFLGVVLNRGGYTHAPL